MRRAILLLSLIALPAFSGCAVSDMLFCVLGDHYSAGGTTRAEKKYHYDQQIEKWKNYDKYGTTP